MFSKLRTINESLLKFNGMTTPPLTEDETIVMDQSAVLIQGWTNRGRLILTTKRIVFLPSTKSNRWSAPEPMSIPFSDLKSIESSSRWRRAFTGLAGFLLTLSNGESVRLHVGNASRWIAAIREQMT